MGVAPDGEGVGCVAGLCEGAEGKEGEGEGDKGDPEREEVCVMCVLCIWYMHACVCID